MIPLVAIGLARFAYALLLPPMRASAMALRSCALRATADLFGALTFVAGATLATAAGAGASVERQGLMPAIYFAGAAPAWWSRA